MKPLIKDIVIVSLVGWMIVVLGTLILSFITFADPFFALEEFFLRYGSTGVYEFEYFGLVFTLWASSSFIPVSSMNLLSSPITIPPLVPFALLLIASGFIGFQVGFKKGIPSTILLLIWGTVLGLALAIIVPSTMPTAGLSPVDQQAIQGLGDEIFRLTYLIPPNLFIELLITAGSCIVSVFLGRLVYKTFFENNSDKTKKKRRQK